MPNAWYPTKSRQTFHHFTEWTTDSLSNIGATSMIRYHEAALTVPVDLGSSLLVLYSVCILSRGGPRVAAFTP